MKRRMHNLVAVVGNRIGWSFLEVSMKLDIDGLVTPNDIIVSGGAEGVDTYAQAYAKNHGIPMVILYPDPSIPSPRRFYERNQWIAEISDIVVAFNQKNRKSGTLQTINYANKLNKKVIVVEK